MCDCYSVFTDTCRMPNLALFTVGIAYVCGMTRQCLGIRNKYFCNILYFILLLLLLLSASSIWQMNPLPWFRAWSWNNLLHPSYKIFLEQWNLITFLAATKQLYEWFSPSVCPSVCLSHLFDYVPIILSSWNFQELLPVTKVTSMQKVKVRGQRSRSQRSQPNLTVSGL